MSPDEFGGAKSSVKRRPAKRRVRNSIPSYEELQTIVMRAVEGEIEPVRTPLSYRLGILLALVVMVALPLIYIGLIGLAGYGVYYHAVNHTGIMTSVRGGRAMVMAAIVYLSPVIIGGILVLFMFKPLFSRPSRGRGPRKLDREKEPLLFAFVDRLCDAVHAPRPKRIEADLQVNASAGFRQGMWSMLGSDLVLTIGLPLVAGLNMRQFAGVLAHEFGHFSQGAGMRVTFIVRSISHWFQRVVYERDEWDEKLAELSHEIDLRIGWMLYLARLFVWITRKILWCLMMVGNVVAGVMLREMEFDADRHEARFSGSDVFAQTQKKLPLLGLADQQSWNQLGDFYREGRLVDNLPRLCVMNMKELPKEAQAYIEAQVEQGKTGLLDTHPCDRARLENAQREEAAGIFRLKYPATGLFTKFDGLSIAATKHIYQQIFGRSFDPSTLHSVDSLVTRQKEEEDSHQARQRFFQSHFMFDRPVVLEESVVRQTESVDDAMGQLKQLRQEFDALNAKVGPAFEDYADAGHKRTAVRRARLMLKLKVKIERHDFEFDATSRDKIQALEAEAVEIQELTEPTLNRFDDVAARRLSIGLALIRSPEFALKLEESSSLQADVERLLPVLRILGEHIESAIELLDQQVGLELVFNRLRLNDEDEQAIRAARRLSRESVALMNSIHSQLGLHKYPFEHARDNVSVADYCLENVPSAENVGAVYEAAESAAESIIRLYSRTLGSLCRIVEVVEEATGLPRQPEPEEDGDSTDS